MTYLTESDKAAHALLKSRRAADTRADHRIFPLSPDQMREIRVSYGITETRGTESRGNGDPRMGQNHNIRQLAG